MKIERRYVPAAELRVLGTEDKPKIAGYAAVFNSASVDLGGFRERILPGAFSGPLANGDDVRALIDHDSRLILGRTKSGSLKLSQDEVGLRYEVEPGPTSYARDLVASIQRGDVDQSSFAFTVKEDRWHTEDGGNMREIVSVDQLFDVSPVTYPAYEATSAELRSMEGLFAVMGVDFGKLAPALVRMERGLEKLPGDEEILEEAFRRIFRKPAPSGSPIALLEQRLRLAEKRS